MTRDEAVKEIEAKFKEASRKKGFFVMITEFDPEKEKPLGHYQCQADFPKDDLARSLIEVARLAGVVLVEKSEVVAGDVVRGRTWN